MSMFDNWPFQRGYLIKSFESKVVVAEKIKYYPVFAGKTKEDEEVIIYKPFGSDGDELTHLYIQRPDGEFLPISLGSDIETIYDQVEQRLTVNIRSPEWTGTASGTKYDFENAECR